jgi:UDP-glucose 4-epimerase
MRIMVTGASGWIGGYVLDEIERRGIEGVGTGDRNSSRHEIRLLDVTEREAVFAVLNTTRPDVVINLAGRLGTDELAGEEYDAVRVNVLGAVNVFDAAATFGARVVQIGTGHKGQPNAYALTKACAEDLALTRVKALDEAITIVRAFHAYGPRQGIPAPHGRATVRKIVPSFVCRALTDMPIEIFGDGKNLIDLVYVGDVAEALVDAAVTGVQGEVFEAGVGRDLAVVDIAEYVIDACRSGSRVVHLTPRAGEPVGARAVADDPYCANPWPYMLDETIAWYADALGVKR